LQEREWERSGRKGRCGQNTESLPVHVTECSGLKSPLQASSSCALRLDFFPLGHLSRGKELPSPRCKNATEHSYHIAPAILGTICTRTCLRYREFPNLLPARCRETVQLPTHSVPYIHTVLHPQNHLTPQHCFTQSEI